MKWNGKTWREFECSDAVAINIPGYRKQLYINYDLKKIYINSTYGYSKYSPVVVIYQNQNNLMDDVLIEFYIHNYESNTTTPIPRDIICRYLELYPDFSSVDIDGRCFFKCMNDISVLLFAAGHFGELLLQFLYPKINSVDASKEVIESYNRFVKNISAIKDKKYESFKVDVMNEIEFDREKIDEQMSLIDTCANNSADALNELSEKFGIEVEL